MFNNIGEKIKGLAKFIAYSCVICGIIIAVIGLIKYASNREYIEYASIYGGAGYGHSILTEAGDKAYTGLQMLKYGLVSAVTGFIGSWPLYGFGELIDKVTVIAYHILLKKED